ncbi:hypothetical protein DUNSADRAFT_16577 [Dunaliella salina]|uniref:Encoded protein n=1 Tax=Dunaliella salina TaxID=3046 RepID=A0ABQ7H0W3_DUNSA|nr:hypothetical protein DUNSADRAFT_16577 [Dunaliella salina]|eukprot:KAF5840486.1 hypothetical protein DUNSADRAFT_16577 [Dunaliella salina]
MLQLGAPRQPDGRALGTDTHRTQQGLHLPTQSPFWCSHVSLMTDCTFKTDTHRTHKGATTPPDMHESSVFGTALNRTAHQSSPFLASPPHGIEDAWEAHQAGHPVKASPNWAM